MFQTLLNIIVNPFIDYFSNMLLIGAGMLTDGSFRSNTLHFTPLTTTSERFHFLCFFGAAFFFTSTLNISVPFTYFYIKWSFLFSMPHLDCFLTLVTQLIENPTYYSNFLKMIYLIQNPYTITDVHLFFQTPLTDFQKETYTKLAIDLSNFLFSSDSHLNCSELKINTYSKLYLIYYVFVSFFKLYDSSFLTYIVNIDLYFNNSTLCSYFKDKKIFFDPKNDLVLSLNNLILLFPNDSNFCYDMLKKGNCNNLTSLNASFESVLLSSSEYYRCFSFVFEYKKVWLNYYFNNDMYLKNFFFYSFIDNFYFEDRFFVGKSKYPQPKTYTFTHPYLLLGYKKHTYDYYYLTQYYPFDLSQISWYKRNSSYINVKNGLFF